MLRMPRRDPPKFSREKNQGMSSVGLEKRLSHTTGRSRDGNRVEGNGDVKCGSRQLDGKRLYHATGRSRNGNRVEGNGETLAVGIGVPFSALFSVGGTFGTANCAPVRLQREENTVRLQR